MLQRNGLRTGSLTLAVTIATALAIAPATALAATLSSTDHISRGAINGNGIDTATFRFVSGDGARVLFDTDEQLASSDTDIVTDTYMRQGSTTTHISRVDDAGTPAPIPNQFMGASANGTRAFFFTNEQMTADDTDQAIYADIFMREGNSTIRISKGVDAAHDNGNFQADWGGTSADGSRVLVTTAEQLTADDTDAQIDTYLREPASSTTTLISKGPTGGNGAFPAYPAPNFASSLPAGGTKVFFQTDEQLTSTDTDNQTDIYMREGSTTTQISQGAINGNGAFPVPSPGNFFVSTSEDGTRVFFGTDEKLAATDTDNSTDWYMRQGSTTTHLTQGAINGNGAFPVPTPSTFFALPSKSGAHFFFTSDEQLTADDTDNSTDLYLREGSTTTRMSRGAASTSGNGAFPALGAAHQPEGGRIFFHTLEKLAPTDTDSDYDLYLREGSATTHISQGAQNGNGAFTASLDRASADGSRVFFHTDEQLAATDTDSATDVYLREGSTTTHVTRTAQAGNAGVESFGVGASDDGYRFFFRTGEQMLSTDTDPVLDIYAANIGPDGPTGLSTVPASPSSDNGPRVKGTTGPGTVDVRVYKTGDCTGAFATGTTAEFEGSGIQITVGDNSNTQISALGVNAVGNASSCSTSLAYIEDSTAPPPPSVAGECKGLVATITGTDSPESLKGTSGPDVIAALGGNDKVKGGLGNDVICGGDGNDKLNGAAGKDKLYGDAGKDRLSGGGSKGDLCNGGASKDKANGSCERERAL